MVTSDTPPTYAHQRLAVGSLPEVIVPGSRRKRKLLVVLRGAERAFLRSASRTRQCGEGSMSDNEDK